MLEEKAGLEPEVERLELQRRDIANAIDKAVLNLYRYCATGGGQAVVKVERGMCQGCRITLPYVRLAEDEDRSGPRAMRQLRANSACELMRAIGYFRETRTQSLAEQSEAFLISAGPMVTKPPQPSWTAKGMANPQRASDSFWTSLASRPRAVSWLLSWRRSQAWETRSLKQREALLPTGNNWNPDNQH